MPGCGKSTLAVKIAKHFNLTFIDSDERIEKKYKMPISKIFRLVGETGFRKLEKNIFEDIVNSEQNYILATGGGLPCHENNMEIIKNAGISFYLKMETDLLTQRLYNSKKARPLTANMSKDKIQIYITKLLKQREAYYLKSDFIYTKAMGSFKNFVEKKIYILQF